MATFQFFDQAAELITDNIMDAANDTFKVFFISASGNIPTSYTTLEEVTASGAYSVTGNNIPETGITLNNTGFYDLGTTAKMFDADDVDLTVTGGNFGPFWHYVIYDDSLSGDMPVCSVKLTSETTILQNQNLSIVWGSSGIFAVRQA